MEFRPGQIDRRTFLKFAGATGIVLASSVLPGCSSEYVRESEDPDGRKTKLILPNGERNFESGIYSLILPEGYLRRLPYTKAAVTNGSIFRVELGIDVQGSLAKLSGVLNASSIPLYEEWRVSGPVGNTNQGHIYEVHWEKQGFERLLWDGQIINPPKESPSPTI